MTEGRDGEGTAGHGGDAPVDRAGAALPEHARRDGWRHRLETRRRTLVAALDEMDAGGLGQSQKEALSELSSYDNHPADLGTETWQRSQGFAFRTQFRETLEEVEAALGRIEAGDYGLCERCRRPIPEGRLQALPETRHCVTCSAALGDRRERDARARPVEEELLSPPFGRTFTDGEDQVGFDGEDTWQAVAEFGSSDTPSDVPGARYPHIVIDADERHGAVEAVENAVGADGEPVPGAEDDR